MSIVSLQGIKTDALEQSVSVMVRIVSNPPEGGNLVMKSMAIVSNGRAFSAGVVTLLGLFLFLLPLFPVLLLHLSHACVAPRTLGLASSLLGSLYFYFLGVDSL